MGTYYDALWIASAMIFKIQRGGRDKIDALKAGLESGINFIDTAEIYQSETLVCEAIRGRKRDELFIATKVWSNHLRPDKVEKSCRKSLSRLGTSYVDLYQIHFPNSRVPIADTMGAMEKLVEDGLIRNIGISNFSYKDMLAAESALKRHELTSTQMHYNMLHRDVEKEILPHCEKERIAMMAYYPLAHGKLTKSSSKAYEAINKICQNRNLTSAQVALAWLISKSPVNFPIPRASRINHVRENAAAGDVVLTPEEIRNINENVM